MYALKIANGMFAPSVTALVNYTSGEGGRRISIPVGDLMNPVYATLNQLTGSNQFPQIENVNQNFFPKDFYDARVRTAMPIINTDLLYNRKIKAQQTILQEFEVKSYQRELIRNIKVAYFQYLTALEGKKIYEAAYTRALEGKRVNESLLKNGKGLPAYLLRSESEIENTQSHLIESEKQAENAKMYFNFLLNRDLNSDILTEFNGDEILSSIPDLAQQTTSYDTREELLQLQTLTNINQNIAHMTSLYWAPRVSAFVDIGAQAEHFKYNSQAQYYLFGIQLEMPLFTGFINRNKVNQAKLDVTTQQLSFSQAKNNFRLLAAQSHNALQSELQNYNSAKKQLEAAASYQRLVEKGYKEGVNTFIETIDARNQLTQAQLLVTVNQFKVLIAHAALERETASIVLNNVSN
jgi:outer membrane protein TolC